MAPTYELSYSLKNPTEGSVTEHHQAYFHAEDDFEARKYGAARCKRAEEVLKPRKIGNVLMTRMSDGKTIDLIVNGKKPKNSNTPY